MQKCKSIGVGIAVVSMVESIVPQYVNIVGIKDFGEVLNGSPIRLILFQPNTDRGLGEKKLHSNRYLGQKFKIKYLDFVKRP